MTRVIVKNGAFQPIVRPDQTTDSAADFKLQSQEERWQRHRLQTVRESTNLSVRERESGLESKARSGR